MNQQDFINELAKLRTSATFLTLHGYRSEAGEISDFSIVFHISYKNALEKSIQELEKIIPTSVLEAQAKSELIDGYHASLKKNDSDNPDNITDAYERFFDSNGTPIKGVKLHKDSKTLHLYGMVVHKKVRIPGTYKEKNSKELTIAKDNLRKLCPVSKFRQFKLTHESVEKITVENISLLPPQSII
jgi:hypothetical protein